MRLLGRTGRPHDNPRLDAQMHEIFDDRRTPDAPDTLYSYLREVAMDSSTERNHGRFWFLGSGMGPKMRAVAALAIVLVVAAGAVGAVVVIPRAGGVGGNPSPSAEPSWPAAPSAPAGWHMLSAASGGGLMGFDPAEPRIAVHVLCKGPDDVIVMARTYRGTADAGSLSRAYGQYSQSALIDCLGTGWQEGRFEFTAPTGSPFVEIYATEIAIIGGTVPTQFWVSIEVPD